MKKNLLFLICSVCLFNVSAFGSIYVNYDFVLSGDGTLTTPNGSWAIVETFNDYPTFDQPTWTWSGNGTGRLGSDSGSPQEYAAPYNSSEMSGEDATYYYSVPQNMDGEEEDWDWAMVTFPEGETYDYLGLFWGSIDEYNTFQFLNDGSEVATFTGSDLAAFPNGNQSAAGQNFYVNFYNLPEFDAVKFISTYWAFEFDNLAVGVTPVPVPGATLLALLGLSVAGVKLRKFV